MARPLRILVPKNEEHYRALADSVPGVVYSTTADGACDYCNQWWYDYTGLSREQTLGDGWATTLHPDDRERVLANWRERLRDGRPFQGEHRLRRADGSYRWFLDRAMPVRDQEGRVVRWFGTCIDIDDRKRAEDELRRSEEKFRSVVENIQDVIAVFDPDCRYTYINQATTNYLPLKPEEFVGKTLGELGFPADHVQAWEARIREVFQTGERKELELVLDDADGARDGPRYFNWRLFPEIDETGRVRHVITASLETTQHRRAEAEVLRTATLLKAVADGTSDAVFVKDRQGRYLLANPATARFIGRPIEEIVGSDDTELFEPDSAQRIMENDRRVMASGEVHSQEERLTAAGTTRTFMATKAPYRDANGCIVGIIGVSRDITDRKQAESEYRQMEEQFRQAQKLEAVGRLASGVAHDFNNMLTVIQGCCEVLLHTMPLDDRSRELVEEIHRAGQQSASLTRQLLVFGRKQVVQPRVLDLNETVSSAEKLLRRMIGEDVLLKTVLRPLAGRVKTDPGQLEQVLMNLAVNARDAMPTGGRLTIETANADLDDVHASMQAGVEQGPYVVLVALSDTGCGMTEDVKARIFEPFFTTKEAGKGTGLGLAVVHGIVQQAGGHVEVDSEPGRGTTFKIYLPRLEEQARPGNSRLDVQSPPRGTETVLLVEDEEEVRTLTRRVLRGCGYYVLEAADGDAALRVAAGHDGPIHLLLTDVVMPGMGGRPLAQRLLAIHPKAKVLYISGYTDDAVVRHGVLEDRVHFLQKPFSPVALALKLREVLDCDGPGLPTQAGPRA